MTKTLLIVESPGKIDKIQKILGDDYIITASYGHIMDLDANNMSIDINNKFEPKYVVNKHEIVNKLKKLAMECDEVLIATDKDREGEMIGWSIAHVLNLKDPKRISFSEITKTELLSAVSNPKKLDYNYINAQKTRRVLDRLVGYEISPILQKTIYADSAGRVQSVVVKIIIDKENEIKNFNNGVSQFSFKGTFTDKTNNINALMSTKIDNYETSKQLIEKLSEASHKIEDIIESESTSRPSAPFTTSTLQQEAYYKYGMNAKRTMSAAQHLYEAGQITYMRTDSVNLSQEALGSIKKYILQNYNENYYRLIKYKSNGNSQEAHEAIRPTHISVEKLKETGKIKSDEIKLYSLIWKRTVASQMTPAKYNVTTIIIKNDKTEHKFTSQCKKIVFNGYLAVYNIENAEKEDEDENISDSNIVFKKDAKLEIIELTTNEQYNKQPSRYNEASLIKRLDPKDLNIGRPSTYATILNVIQEREYVKLEDIAGIEKDVKILKWTPISNLVETTNKITVGKETKKLIPTHLGHQVTEFMNKHFSTIMDYKFTANMEDDLDEIAEGKLDSYNAIKKLYEYMHPIVIKISENILSNKIETNKKLLGIHPETKQEIYTNIGKYGAYLEMNQIGMKSISAPIKDPYKITTITIENAVEIFEYPKNLGKYRNGIVYLKKGKYGLYLTCGKHKIPIKDIEEPITMEKATELIKNHDVGLFTKKDGKTTYAVMKGPYGLFVQIKSEKKTKSVSIPNDVDISNLTLDILKDLIKNKKSKIKTKYKKTNKKIE